jgi:hypothetical protein
LPDALPFNGLVLAGRQNHREQERDVRIGLVQASHDGQACRGATPPRLGLIFDPQTVAIDAKLSARYLKLAALSGFGVDRGSESPWACVCHFTTICISPNDVLRDEV